MGEKLQHARKEQPRGGRDEAEIARSAHEAHNTVLSPTYIDRYVNPPANTAFPLEYAFYLLGNVQDKHVLDLGCGTGEVIPALVRRGAHVTGIDISPDLIALAQKRMHRQNIWSVDLRAACACETQLPNHSVDIIFAMSVLHHLEISLVVSEMRRILKPDGFIVIKEPISFSWMYAKLRAVFPAKDDVSEYEHPLTKEEFAQIQEGFLVLGLRLFRLPFAAIARYLGVKPKLFMQSSDWILRHCHYLEHFATIVVMKLEFKTGPNQRRI